MASGTEGTTASKKTGGTTTSKTGTTPSVPPISKKIPIGGGVTGRVRKEKK